MSFNDDGEGFRKKTGVPLRTVQSPKRDTRDNRSWSLLKQVANSGAPDAKHHEVPATPQEVVSRQKNTRWQSSSSPSPAVDPAPEPLARPVRRQQFAGLLRKEAERGASGVAAGQTALKPLLKRIADLSGVDHGEGSSWL